MSRKEATFTATDGRDAGKQFALKEMPASQSEAWAIRLLLAAGSSGLDIPAELAMQGFVGLLAVGFSNLMKVPFETAAPLLAEMMSCVKRIEPAMPQGRMLLEDDIEEIVTRFKLRKAVWDLHASFFADAGPSTSGSDRPAAPASSSTIKTPPRR